HANGLNIPDSVALLTVAFGGGESIAVSSVTVGQNLQAQIQVTLSAPVPGPLPLVITLTSGDDTKLVLGSPVGLGDTKTMLQFPVGSMSGIAYAQALGNSGTVTVTGSAQGYSSGSGTVTLTPSAFVISGPAGVPGVPTFNINQGSTTPLTVSTARLDS